MKYQKNFNNSNYKWCLKFIRKKYFGKIRQRKVRRLLKDIDFEIQNMDYKKIYSYGREDIFKKLKRYNKKPRKCWIEQGGVA